MMILLLWFSVFNVGYNLHNSFIHLKSEYLCFCFLRVRLLSIDHATFRDYLCSAVCKIWDLNFLKMVDMEYHNQNYVFIHV